MINSEAGDHNEKKRKTQAEGPNMNTPIQETHGKKKKFSEQGQIMRTSKPGKSTTIKSISKLVDYHCTSLSITITAKMH